MAESDTPEGRGSSAAWTTPADLDAQVRRHWEKGRLLVTAEDGGVAFPLALRLKGPSRRALSEQFDEAKRWVQALEEGAKGRRGFGYEVAWAEIELQVLGRNRLPKSVIVPTPEDALRMVGKRRDAERFAKLASATTDACPALRPWMLKKPLVVLEHAAEWDRVLAVVECLRAQPRPGLYLRQLDIPGVDTKFVEARRGLLIELLDLALEPGAVDLTAGRHFEARYGLLHKEPLVRFRILDPRHRIGGLCDVTTPASELARIQLGVTRVFITENEINGLAFPDVPDAAVVFGLGYDVDRLRGVTWLHGKDLIYWGDIDTHGFAILDRLRGAFPHTRSLLMDRETLNAHRASWVEETARHSGPLSRLTTAEHAFFEDLASDRLGERVRLEQERIGFRWAEQAIASACLRGAE